MLYGNSFINPIIYSICNDQFRTGFRDLFGSCLQPCNFLLKITGLAKSDPERTLSRTQNDRQAVRSGEENGHVLHNGYNRERHGENAKMGVERSGCGGKYVDRNKPRLTQVASTSKIEDAVYVSAVWGSLCEEYQPFFWAWLPNEICNWRRIDTENFPFSFSMLHL